MLCALKKTLGVCLIGLGLGILLVLLLPISGWLFTIGLVIVIVGLMWLSCLRGIVKLLFGIKEKWYEKRGYSYSLYFLFVYLL